MQAGYASEDLALPDPVDESVPIAPDPVEEGEPITPDPAQEGEPLTADPPAALELPEFYY